MRNLYVLGLSLITTFGYAQETTKIDTVAVDLIDKMSAVIGELGSVSFELVTASDAMNDLMENERNFGTHEIQMFGPDKMAIHSRGDKGNRAFWYNGEVLTYYSFDENNYVTVEAPDTIITMIDSMHATYNFKFPAADLFYPTLTDDILDNFDSVKYLGLKMVDGQECFHIMGSSKTMSFQLWIANDAFFLPKRYLFIDKEKSFQQHEGTFTNWELNPTLPESMFDFVPPKKAKLISILSKS
jgi:hypothetical protein